MKTQSSELHRVAEEAENNSARYKRWASKYAKRYGHTPASRISQQPRRAAA